MSQQERRRGGGGGGNYVLRTGSSSHATRHGSSTMTSPTTMAGVGSSASSMPAAPPRAAAPGSHQDEQQAHEASAGGVAFMDTKDKDKNGEAQKKLSEREDRIAYLEKEMTIMEREFQQELDKLSQNESETATFWQSKHSALNQQFLRTDTELRLLRNEVDAREAEREDLGQAVDLLRRELRERDEEIRRLRAQVRGLKDFVSTSTRTDDQTSDEVFGDGMTRLGNGLQNWVITNFRKAKIDLNKVGAATIGQLSELVPMHEELIHTSKVHLLQSAISRILVDTVFDAYYVGLSEDETLHFQQMEEILTTFCSSDEAVNQWRSSTLALMRRSAQHLHTSTDTFAEHITERILTLLTSLTDSPASAVDGLRVLVRNAIELARLLVVQKARLRVHMAPVLPRQRVLFDPETMEDVGGEDEEALHGREVACVVFPGVVKYGDENGENAQFRNVIARMKVLCREGF